MALLTDDNTAPQAPQPAVAKDNVVRLAPHLLRAAHLRVLMSAVDEAQMAFDDEDVRVAAGRFLGHPTFTDAEALLRWLEERDAHAQFLPWLLWDADRSPKDAGMAELQRRVQRACRSPMERSVLRGLRQTRPDVYAVTSVAEKVTVLERLRDGELIHVDEPVLRSMAAVGEVFVARVVHVGGTHLLDAVHASMPAACRPAMLRAARRLPALAPERQLPSLLDAAGRAIGRLQPHVPRFGKGEGRLRWTIVFAVDETPRVAELLRRAVADGQLARVSPLRYAVLDVALGPVGATLRLAGGRLFAATCAKEGVPVLRDGLVALLGLAPQATLVRDLEPLFNPRRRSEWSARELQSIAREWMGECLTAFQDTAQPWLDGATPREAVRTPDGRLRVKAWLNDVERVSEVAGPGYNVAVQRLWRELAGS